MSATGLEVFDRTLQLTNIWLGDIMTELAWQDRQKAYKALRTVLQTLRDRLPVNEAAHLAAQLPLLIRGIYYEGWSPSKTPVNERTQAEFLSHVSAAFSNDLEADPRLITTAVFEVLTRHVDPAEAAKIQNVLPAPLRDFWP